MSHAPFAPLRKLRLQAVALLVLVFGIGILAGIALERGRHPDPPEAPPANRLPAQLRRELELSPDQERNIARILENNSVKSRALMDEFMPRMRALKDSIRTQIRAELTPKQCEIFDRYAHGLDEPPPDRRPHRKGPPPHGGDKPPHPDDGPPREPPAGGENRLD